MIVLTLFLFAPQSSLIFLADVQFFPERITERLAMFDRYLGCDMDLMKVGGQTEGRVANSSPFMNGGEASLLRLGQMKYFDHNSNTTRYVDTGYSCRIVQLIAKRDCNIYPFQFSQHNPPKTPNAMHRRKNKKKKQVEGAYILTYPLPC
jgi:hypothetical protein